MKLIIASALLTIGYSVPQVALSQEFSSANRRLGGSHYIDTTNAASSRLSEQNIESTDSNIDGTELDPRFDVGVLRSQQNSLNRRLATECTDDAGVVVCEDGYNKDSKQSCKDACDGDCCVEEGACDEFTGTVCRDGSCSGIKSCMGANVNEIVLGCIDPYACYYAGDSGMVGKIQNSCTGSSSCAYAGAFTGSISEIVNSCGSDYACYGVAAGVYNEKEGISYEGGTIGVITDSCTATFACNNTAQRGGIIGMVKESCIKESACSYAAQNFGNITGGILSSCGGTSSCESVAAEKGSIGVIDMACNADDACLRAGYGESYIGIESCCNTGTCDFAKGPPPECTLATSAPTSSSAPSTEPSSSPSAYPSISSLPSASSSPSANPATSSMPSVEVTSGPPTKAPRSKSAKSKSSKTWGVKADKSNETTKSAKRGKSKANKANKANKAKKVGGASIQSNMSIQSSIFELV